MDRLNKTTRSEEDRKSQLAKEQKQREWDESFLAASVDKFGFSSSRHTATVSFDIGDDNLTDNTSGSLGNMHRRKISIKKHVDN